MTTIKRDMSLFEKMLSAFAASRVGGWYFVNIAPFIDRPLIRLTSGRINTGFGLPIGLLYLTGAKRGLPRQTPVLCVPDGKNFIVVASRAGDTRHPDWYYNLRAHPDIHVQIWGRKRAYTAHEANGDERAELWHKAVYFYPGRADYQQRAGTRQIPVFLLSPQT